MNIGKKIFDLFDESRNKYISVSVYYPTNEKVNSKNLAPIWKCKDVSLDAELSSESKKFPLIILSHGNGGNNSNLTWISDYFAPKGFILITLNHQEDIHDYNDMSHIEYWNRPLDISFVISSIKKISFFKNNIDFKKVGIIGYSLGGLTVAWLLGAITKKDIIIPKQKMTKSFEYPKGFSQKLLDEIDPVKFHQNLSDSIFQYGILLAPARGFPNSWGGSEQQKLLYGKNKKPSHSEGMLLEKEGLEKIKKPILIIAASHDECTENSTNSFYYHNNIQGSELEIIRGNHYVFLNQFHKKPAIEYLDDYLIKKQFKKEKEILREQRKAGRLIFKFITETYLMLK